MSKRTLYGSLITTYRCNAKCNMCNCFQFPTHPDEEWKVEIIDKLPEMAFTNITGGEPFIRQDIHEIVDALYRKTDRIVISTNGFFTEKIITLCQKFPRIGIRISIEGMQETNDAIRGIKDGFSRGYETLKTLVNMKHPDVGFGMTVQDSNCDDLIKLYQLSNEMNMEFATATLHNSFYFRKIDNKIDDKLKVAKAFENLINELLKSGSPKKWFRAYFNHGLINYIYGNPRLLPCDMGSNAFFLDPYGDIIPCNGTEKKMPMGNLNEKSWGEIWNSSQANEVRANVNKCERNCWMIGSVSPAMKQRIWVPLFWVLRHKLMGNRYKLNENCHDRP